MTLMVKRLTDIAIILAVSAAIVFCMILGANSFVSKASVWQSYNLWLGFVRRPDIVATTLLVVAVTMAVTAFQPFRFKR